MRLGLMKLHDKIKRRKELTPTFGLVRGESWPPPSITSAFLHGPWRLCAMLSSPFKQTTPTINSRISANLRWWASLAGHHLETPLEITVSRICRSSGIYPMIAWFQNINLVLPTSQSLRSQTSKKWPEERWTVRIYHVRKGGFASLFLFATRDVQFSYNFDIWFHIARWEKNARSQRFKPWKST